MLEFELIAKTIEYANSFKRKIKYGISTNGTLLTHEFIKWIGLNPNVYVTITINGENHDRYRVNRNGDGTLNTIIDKIDFIKANYPAIWENQIRIITNYYSLEEIIPLSEFFLDKIQKIPIAITHICLDYASLELCYQFKLNEQRESLMKTKLTDKFINQLDPFIERLFEAGLDKVVNRGLCTFDTPGYIDSCVPLVWRLFIRSDGSINLCEKVTDHLCLGDIYRGFDEDKILKLYHEMKDFCNRNCKDCWAQRLCMFCFQDIIDENGKIIERFSEEECKTRRLNALDYLKMYIKLVNIHGEYNKS